MKTQSDIAILLRALSAILQAADYDPDTSDPYELLGVIQDVATVALTDVHRNTIEGTYEEPTVSN